VVHRTLASNQKKAEEEGRTIVWVDESGFYLLPAVVRTYAPRGQTPVLRVPLTRDHLSAISGITLGKRLLLLMQDHSLNGEDVVGFLKHLLRRIPGKLLVIWDGSPIHRGQSVKNFLANGAAKRIHLEQLPGYAPDLNPDEGIWKYLKWVELRNVCCSDLAHLHHELNRAVAQLRLKPQVIHGCVAQGGYHL
jgi:transposase